MIKPSDRRRLSSPAVELFSLPGADRTQLAAMAAHIRGGRGLDEAQMVHVLRIGYRAGIADGREAPEVLAAAVPAVLRPPSRPSPTASPRRPEPIPAWMPWAGAAFVLLFAALLAFGALR